MRRVYGKQRGDDGAAPRLPGAPSEEQEKQQCVGEVEEQVYEVLLLRIYAEEFNVQHVGQSGHWMPGNGMGMRESPNNTVPGQASQDVRIVADVRSVVVVDELEMGGRPINGRCAECQQQTDDWNCDCGPSGRHSRVMIAKD
jgi:hypothetical protein